MRLFFWQVLVSGMAEAGEGKAEFIKPGDNMEEKVLRQLKRALKPAFTDITVDFGTDFFFFLPPPHFFFSFLLLRSRTWC